MFLERKQTSVTDEMRNNVPASEQCAPLNDSAGADPSSNWKRKATPAQEESSVYEKTVSGQLMEENKYEFFKQKAEILQAKAILCA